MVSQVTQQCIMEDKFWNLHTLQQCLLCVAEFRIALVEKRPIRSLMPTRVENGSYGHDQWLVEAVCNIIGATFLVLDVQMKLLQICGPLLMEIILQLPLCLYGLQGPVVCVDDCFLPQNVMLPLSTSLHNGIHLFVISRIQIGRASCRERVSCMCGRILDHSCREVASQKSCDHKSSERWLAPRLVVA